MEMDNSKRIQKLRNYASLADDEGDVIVRSNVFDNSNVFDLFDFSYQV